eukprot:gene10768-11968_t
MDARNGYVSLIVQPPKEEPEIDQKVAVVASPHQTASAPPIPPATIEETFAEMVVDQPVDRSKILIVLDCANIGWNYGLDRFSAKGVQLSLDFFSAWAVEVRAFLPESYMKKNTRCYLTQAEAYESHTLLSHYLAQRRLSLVPSGDSDDAYILNYARENNGFIVSNDQYRDHIASLQNESIRLSMQFWLSENRCQFTFSSEEFILNPASALSFALRKDKMLTDTSILTTNILGDNECELHGGSAHSRLLDRLGQAAKDAMALNRPHLLEHILLARSHLLLEVGEVSRSKEEARLIVDHLNPVSAEAYRILQTCDIYLT